MTVCFEIDPDRIALGSVMKMLNASRNALYWDVLGGVNNIEAASVRKAYLFQVVGRCTVCVRSLHDSNINLVF